MKSQITIKQCIEYSIPIPKNKGKIRRIKGGIKIERLENSSHGGIMLEIPDNMIHYRKSPLA